MGARSGSYQNLSGYAQPSGHNMTTGQFLGSTMTSDLQSNHLPPSRAPMIPNFNNQGFNNVQLKQKTSHRQTSHDGNLTTSASQRSHITNQTQIVNSQYYQEGSENLNHMNSQDTIGTMLGHQQSYR